MAAMIEKTGSSPFTRIFSAYDGGAVGADELVFDFDDTGTHPIIKGVNATIHGTSITRQAAFDDGQYHHLEIGRASCRERV